VARERARMPLSHAAAAHEARRRTLEAQIAATRVRYRAGERALALPLAALLRARDALLHAPASQQQSPHHRLLVPRCAQCAADAVVDPDSERCLACGARTCLRCGAAAADDDDDHVCDAGAVASRRLMAERCRPCPGCGAPTERAEGCAVMWCAHCGTFWDWERGRPLEGTPHNPDHVAWLRRGGAAPREVGDVPCGGLVEREELHEALLRAFMRRGALDVPPGAAVVAAAGHAAWRAQSMRHAPRYAVRWDEARVAEPLRVARLLGDLPDDARFGAALERADRKRRLGREVGWALEAFTLGATDLLQRFCRDPATSTEAIAVELEALRAHVAAALLALGAAHGRVVPWPRVDWTWALPHRPIVRE
jgi:hypothetical protein